MSRRLVVASAAIALALSSAGHAQTPPERWIPTWAAPDVARVDQPAQALTAAGQTFPWANDVPQAVREAAPGQQLEIAGGSRLHFNDQTLRQVARVSMGGGRVRVVLTNTFGTVPLRIGAAQVALRDRGPSIVAGSNRVLTFGGLAQPAIPPGALMVSDPVDLAVPDFADLVVDLYLPGDTAAARSPVTYHPASWQTNYVSTQGNHAGAVAFPVATTTAYRRGDGLASASSFFLSRVEVVTTQSTGVLVAFGDSITDGTQSGMDQNRRWPNLLAARLAEAGIRMSVVNGGIGGGRVLEDGVGPNGLARFDRDVLAQAGATHVTVMLGINDIGNGGARPDPSVAELIAGHRQFIERARARGLRVYGATLTPFQGAAYWTPEGEAKRQALNEWIRTGGAYDAVLDFAAATQDPAHPTRMRPEHDSGDHLHPSPAGYTAMANSIDIGLFRGANH
ncbi:SGNH/GDSL hydrolase family protein [Falsiroseomonas sp. HW251]|uniref:SGNH/GDSL hydrolase family protein n=1 Tax=Falsiroseomonas sp. HW251 TaxID=3390998 RepID=UPI003D31945B